MSDSQAYEEVNIASDGVTVIKRFEEDEFPVPAIAFEFSSGRDETVTVRLSDVVPEGVEVEDLGFHPEYGSEFWTVDDDEIAFEKELEAEGEYTTVYGIRATGTDDVEQFLTTPEIDEVDPPLPESEEVIPESDDDVVRDVIAGEGDVPGLEEEDEEGEETDESVETLDLKDPNAAEEAGSSAESGGTAEADVSAEGSVVTAMANEIRENNVSVDDLKLLDRAFQKVSGRSETTTSSSGGATDARVEKIQSDVADLRAYTDAIEEFLEDEGTGQQLISEFEDRLDEFANDLDSMQSEVESVSEEVDSVSGDLDNIGSEVSSLGEEVDTVSNDVASVESTVEEVDSAVDSLEEAVEELESEVAGGEVADRMEDLEQEIVDLQEWQEQIKSTFGG